MAESGDLNQNEPLTSIAGMSVPAQFVISSGTNMNIDKLEGVSNYATWKFQMKLLLIDNGLWECVCTQAPDLNKDQKAYAKICLSVKPVCSPHVRNAQTAAEAWNNLKLAYENMGISRRLQLKRKLSQIKYSDFSIMDHYLGEIISVSQELSDIGCVIEDEELAELMLIGLPNYFDSLLMAIEGTQTKLSSEYVKARLIQGEFKRNDGMVDDMKSKALVVKNKFVPVCHHCKSEGHIKPRCPEFRRDKKNKKKHFNNSCFQQASTSKQSCSMSEVKDSAAVQMLLETCLETQEDKETPGQLLALQEVRSLVCCYLHQVFIADTTLAKLVHFQGYPSELLEVTVKGVPSMHICLDFLLELMQQPSISKQIFAIQLLSHLSIQYALPKSLNLCVAALNLLYALLGGLSSAQRIKLFKPVLPALARISEAFPPLVEDIVQLLIQLSRVCKSQASIASYFDDHLSWNSGVSVQETEELCELAEATFTNIINKTVLKTDIYN